MHIKMIKDKLSLLSRVGLSGFIFVASSHAYALNCQQVKQLTEHFLSSHYSVNKFDDALSERTLSNYLKAWDPGKVYFLQSDIDTFKKKYETKLDDLIAKEDCSAVEDVVNVYSKRFTERQKYIPTLIKMKHDYTIDEYMIIDRKKLSYAKTTEEINDRWRKRVKYQYKQLQETLKDPKKVREKLYKRYKLVVKRNNDMTSDDMYSMFLNSFAMALDPHSDYLSPDALEDFRIATRLSLDGIGAVLRSEDGFTVIQRLVPGGAAFKTEKVKVDDKIIAVAQGDKDPVDVVDMSLRDVVKLIRGKKGTEVRLTLSRKEAKGHKTYIVPIIREKIQLDDRSVKSYVYEVNALEGKGKGKKAKTSTYKVGVIDLPSFYMDFQGRQAHRANFKSSSTDMLKEVMKLKKDKVDAIIVDIRSNGGGALDESVKIAGLFFDDGPVVQIKKENSPPYEYADQDGQTYYDGPLILMIDRQSASASEIIAGALQDYGRAIIVGDTHSFGKGTVQNMTDLSAKLGAIKVTISKFYRPDGSSTQLKGVSSDIVLPSITEKLDIGEKFYDYALAWDKVKAAKHQKFKMVAPYIAALTKSTSERIAKDKDFDDIRKAIKEFDKNKEETSRVSLKEKKEDKKLTKDEKKKEDKKDLVADTNKAPDLKEDVLLKATVQMAADYIRLLKKQDLVELKLPQTTALGQAIAEVKKVKK